MFVTFFSVLSRAPGTVIQGPLLKKNLLRYPRVYCTEQFWKIQSLSKNFRYFKSLWFPKSPVFFISIQNSEAKTIVSLHFDHITSYSVLLHSFFLLYNVKHNRLFHFQGLPWSLLSYLSFHIHHEDVSPVPESFTHLIFQIIFFQNIFLPSSPVFKMNSLTIPTIKLSCFLLKVP